MYSDAGLLGAMVVCEAASAGKVVGAVAAALRSAQASGVLSVLCEYWLDSIFYGWYSYIAS